MHQKADKQLSNTLDQATSNALIQSFFDEDTNTFSYVVADLETRQCAIIDSVLNYNAASVSTQTTLADQIVDYIQQQKLQVQWILETHVHADHLSAAQYLKSKLGGVIGISQKIQHVQQTFAKIYHLDEKELIEQQDFDYLFADHEAFKIGNLSAYNIPTPGHTPACLSYVIEDAVFVGDTLFMHDYGTARCDFPHGDAAQLFDSIQRSYQLPEHFSVFLCHDYLPDSRTEYVYQTTIGAQKNRNIHLKYNTLKTEFVAMREKRDADLSVPKLMIAAIQINMKAGKFPEPEANGIRYLKMPLNYFD